MGNVLDLRELSSITYGFLNGLTYDSVLPCSQENFVPGALLSNRFVTRDDGTRVNEFDVWYERNKTMYDGLQLPPGNGKKQVMYLPTTIGGLIQYNDRQTHWRPTVTFVYNRSDKNNNKSDCDIYFHRMFGYVILEENKWYDLAISYEFDDDPFDLIDPHVHIKNRAFVEFISKLFL